MKVVGKQKNSRMCFICGMDNPVGLKAQFYNMEDGSVMTIFKTREDLQSFPDNTHGGITATMLDELGLRAIWVKEPELCGVTAMLNVKYRKRVRYGVELIGRGKEIKRSGKISVIKTEIFDKYGSLLAQADATYILMPIEEINKDMDIHKELCYLIEDDIKEINFENKEE